MTERKQRIIYFKKNARKILHPATAGLRMTQHCHLERSEGSRKILHPPAGGFRMTWWILLRPRRGGGLKMT